MAKREKENMCRDQNSSIDRRIRQCRDQHNSIDRISMLPDKILVFILSLLTLKEATKTSILSHRWRYLWTFTPMLDFDGTPLLLKVISALRNFEVRDLDLALPEERCNYVGWVDNVIALHKASTIEEFRVFFNLTKVHRKHIDKWLRYALARKVRRLELNLTNECCRKSRNYHECYTFPHLLLCDSIDFKFLEKLSMHYVNVDGEDVEFFLHNCPLLEHISISQSRDLSTLKIIGPFSSFKRLEISLCHQLNSVEIRDADIVYLKYEGKMIHFVLENVPFVAELYIGGMLTHCMQNVLLLFSSHLPQLEIFTICKIGGNFSMEETELLYSAVKMIHLKQLVVKFVVAFRDSCLPLTNLIRASPYLQRLVLKASHWQPINFFERKFENIVRLRSYPHLKEIEFVGYRGATSELELIMHFLDNAIALEKISIDPHKAEEPMYQLNLYDKKRFMDEIIHDESDARARAKQQLTKIVPPRINLEIL